MNKVIIFVLGAAAGSLVTWKVLDEKYRQLTHEEVEAVREYYKSREKTEKEKDETIFEPEELEEKEVYEEMVEDLGYTVDVPPAKEFIAPYVIAPEEFGDIEGCETKNWTLYADGILTDEVGNIVFEPEEVIGDAKVGKQKHVDPNGELVKAAKSIGVSFGDE